MTRDTKRDPFEGGIGGTGIVGTMSGAGGGALSINGLRAELSRSTRIVTASGPAETRLLAPGQTVTILADRTPEALRARHVRVEYPLVGLLERSGDVLRVNGVDVRIEAGAIRGAGPGQRVALSGLWTPAGVVASRVDPAPDDLDRIAGDVERGGPNGLSIGGTPIVAQAGRSFPPQGSYLLAEGRFADGVLDAEWLSSGRFTFGAAALRQLSVEGYLERVAASPGYRVAGLGHSFARDLRLAPLAASRSVFVGPYDGRFAARAGYALPEGLGARNSLLEGGFDGPLGDRAIATV